MSKICKKCDTRCRLGLCQGQDGDFTYCYRPTGSLSNITKETITPFNDLKELIHVINSRGDALFHLDPKTAELKPYGSMDILMCAYTHDESYPLQYPVGFITR